MFSGLILHHTIADACNSVFVLLLFIVINIVLLQFIRSCDTYLFMYFQIKIMPNQSNNQSIKEMASSNMVFIYILYITCKKTDHTYKY